MTVANFRNCFVAGASRGVGFEVVKGLRQQGCRVMALLRTDDARSQLAALGADVYIGDALDPDVMKAAVQCFGDESFVVVTTLGGKGFTRDEPRADYLGNRNLIDAVKALPCERFILVSSIGVRESAVALPEQVLETLRPALLAKAKAEEHLMASGLPFTIVRPGGLLSEPATGNGIVVTDERVAGSITRADVADLVIRCLRSPDAVNQVLSAVDRDRLRSEQPIEAAILAL
ncbi:SDR family oxidoreductase [Leptolyngbya iicbica]|uniref:SDR family oxidoreductase n=2 Tax=Cyanophyceae TaxID=3028117 RepID=A0A4Q7EEK0_9CYAN|nr:SDR family oxidoreductase [Leptolyngbya sp. LK]RZM82254.1 SDR family oxidoreductase [Leptolyngbya sp. LK]